MDNELLIKSLDSVRMELKNKGIEITVRSGDGKKQVGDLIVKKTGLVWCNGRTTPAKGESINWPEFIGYMKDRSKNRKKKS